MVTGALVTSRFAPRLSVARSGRHQWERLTGPRRRLTHVELYA
jgi:hypothetical protein